MSTSHQKDKHGKVESKLYLSRLCIGNSGFQTVRLVEGRLQMSRLNPSQSWLLGSSARMRGGCFDLETSSRRRQLLAHEPTQIPQGRNLEIVHMDGR